ncbi:MAG: hypothetical protein RMJ19_06830 [Gemmatales bacterium]|nr:hypothetical protein [Gemmatales bacterium]MDW8175369.1 hypothetical protein [Gemmatales bacterium]
MSASLGWDAALVGGQQQALLKPGRSPTIIADLLGWTQEVHEHAESA